MIVVKLQHNRCGFFAWFDLPMCERAKVIILGLLRRMNNEEDRMNSYKSRKKIWCFMLVLSWLIIIALVINFPHGKGN